MCNDTPLPSQLQFDLAPQTREIPLTKGKVALVDAADYDFLMQWKWMVAKKGSTYYAVRSVRINGKKQNIIMHREILAATPEHEIDHKDGNGLNNTRANLRDSTHQQNLCNRPRQRNNTSGYKGVTWSKDKRKWRAQIKIYGKMKSIGAFSNIEDAARAYDAAAKELFGEFAWLNFPNQG